MERSRKRSRREQRPPPQEELISSHPREGVESGGVQEEEGKAQLQDKLEQKILEILHTRAASSTMCPSEAARAVSPTDWRLLMEKTRQVARMMALRGCIHITQKGVICNPRTDFKGPIRLKLATTGGTYVG